MQDILRAEGVAAEDAVLPLVARAGAGSVRDSLSVLDQLLAGSDGSGLRYDRAVALLGYTDASLLDEIVDAFAAADGAAVFEVVNRVVEGGHEPRRFAADLLDRFRDLIILAAVPNAAETGLLDLPPDRAEQMAAAAGRFGQIGLTRAAEIVSTSLDQMRGATSPRLLLELMCAQVLLPAAATDEKSLLTRLERLESADRGTQAPVPAAAPRLPRQAPADHSERPGSPAAGQDIAAPGRPTGSARPPVPSSVPAAEGRSAAPASGGPASGGPAASGPAASVPAATVPALSGPAASGPAFSGPAASVPAPVPQGRPAAAAAQGPATADSLVNNWDAVVEAVKQESRVAWLLLRNASVLSLEDGTLTLRFPREGEMKGFSVSGHDAVLRRVLSTDFGLDVIVKAVTGADSADRPGRPAAGSRPDEAQVDAPRSRPRPSPPRAAEITPDEPDDTPPDEPDTDSAARETELTGMDLIQRELGGQVISEIED
jgi:DNA polymerase-3 subunit gamma/tau